MLTCISKVYVDAIKLSSQLSQAAGVSDTAAVMLIRREMLILSNACLNGSWGSRPLTVTGDVMPQRTQEKVSICRIHHPMHV